MDGNKFTEITTKLNEVGFKDRVSVGPQPDERENLPYGCVVFDGELHDSWVDKIDVMNSLGLLGMRVVGVDGQAVYFEDPVALAKHHTPPGQVG